MSTWGNQSLKAITEKGVVVWSHGRGAFENHRWMCALAQAFQDLLGNNRQNRGGYWPTRLQHLGQRAKVHVLHLCQTSLRWPGSWKEYRNVCSPPIQCAIWSHLHGTMCVGGLKKAQGARVSKGLLIQKREMKKGGKWINPNMTAESSNDFAMVLLPKKRALGTVVSKEVWAINVNLTHKFRGGKWHFSLACTPALPNIRDLSWILILLECEDMAMAEPPRTKITDQHLQFAIDEKCLIWGNNVGMFCGRQSGSRLPDCDKWKLVNEMPPTPFFPKLWNGFEPKQCFSKNYARCVSSKFFTKFFTPPVKY